MVLLFGIWSWAQFMNYILVKVNSVSSNINNSGLLGLIIVLNCCKHEDEMKFWINGTIRRHISERNKAFQASNMTLYKPLRNKVIYEIKQAKRPTMLKMLKC